jgi:hypothetical protein
VTWHNQEIVPGNSVVLGRGGAREERVADKFIKLFRMFLFRHHAAVVKNFKTSAGLELQKRGRVFDWSSQIVITLRGRATANP